MSNILFFNYKCNNSCVCVHHLLLPCVVTMCVEEIDPSLPLLDHTMKGFIFQVIPVQFYKNNNWMIDTLKIIRKYIDTLH